MTLQIKRTLSRLLVSAILLMVITLPVAAQLSKSDEVRLETSTGQILSSSQKRVVFDSTPFSAGSVVPYWDKNYLISITPQVISAASANVRLYDADGHEAREAAIWFPDAETVFILSAAVTAEGHIVASGTAVKHDGTRAYFIAGTDSSGNVTSVIQTNPFFPAFICGTPDGTVWSFGELETRGEGDMLRQFNLAKGLVSSYLPQSTFGNQRRSPVMRGGDGQEVYFRCNATKIAIYSGSSGQYVNFDVESRSAERFKIDRSLVDLPLRGLAVTTGGDVFGHLQDYSKPTSLQGLFHLEFDQINRTVRWEPVSGASGPTTQPGVVSGLWGADGESLVYNVFDDPAGRTGVSWSVAMRNGIPKPQ